MEYVAAVAVATTILLGVTGVLNRELTPPERAPIFVSAAAQPLENHDEYPSRFNPIFGLHGMPSLQGRDGEPIGRFLAKVGRQAAMTARQRAAFAAAFARGASDQALARAHLLLSDPLAQFVPELSPALIPKLMLRILPVLKVPYELAGYVVDVIRHYDEPPNDIAYRLGQRAGDDVFDLLLAKGKKRAEETRDRVLGQPSPAPAQRSPALAGAPSDALAPRSGQTPARAS